jgi:hypothetical protein
MEKNAMPRWVFLAILVTTSTAHCPAQAQHGAPHGHAVPPHGHAAPPSRTDAAAAYAPFEALLGEWEVAPEGGQPMAVERFRWALEGSYIWYGVSLLGPQGERPHFEGMLVWNGVERSLETLVSLESPGGVVLERGTLAVTPSGTFVRDITAYYSEGAGVPGGGKAGPAGAKVRFRQTFRPTSPDRMLTSTLRESEDGWVPTFPGFERMVMTRRRAAGAGR